MKPHSCPSGTNAVTETGWQHSGARSSDGSGLAHPTQPNYYMCFVRLVKLQSCRKATVLQSSKTWVPSGGAFSTPHPQSKGSQLPMSDPPHAAPSTGEHKTRDVCWFVFTAQ